MNVIKCESHEVSMKCVYTFNNQSLSYLSVQFHLQIYGLMQIEKISIYWLLIISFIFESIQNIGKIDSVGYSSSYKEEMSISKFKISNLRLYTSGRQHVARGPQVATGQKFCGYQGFLFLLRSCVLSIIIYPSLSTRKTSKIIKERGLGSIWINRRR